MVLLRLVVLALLVASIVGCGGTEPMPVLDPVETKQKEDEISKGMEKAMQEQMKGKSP